MVDGAVGMVDGDKAGPNGGAKDRLGVAAVVATEKEHAPAHSQKAMDDAATLMEKKIDFAGTKDFVGGDGNERDFVCLGIDEGQHAGAAKGNTDRVTLKQTVV